MLIRLQCEQRQWRVLHPDRPEPIEFRDGARAYDFAETLARLHFVDTGQRAAVRVEASGAFVEAVSYGLARMPAEAGLRSSNIHAWRGST